MASLFPQQPRPPRKSHAALLAFIVASALLYSTLPVHSAPAPQAAQEAGAAPLPQEGEVGLLKLLGLEASPESIDYVQNKTQFQLHTLLTEQRHPKTWNLGERVRKDTTAGLRMLFAVDEDVAARLDALAADTRTLEAAAAAVEQAVLSGKRIYVYGCGATGRLAKQMESAFWRPFWRKVKADDKLWKKLAPSVGADVEDRLIGEMTGADRALISSLEGFEDLLLIGRLQLEDRGVRKGDVVICVTEGGETSSVIGTVLAALDQWKAAPGYDPAESRKSLYFVYNNPDEKLLPFTRSRRVIEEPGITRINLTTGPQSITGSTRMQATTSETYVVGAILEAAVRKALGRTLSAKELGRIGFEGSWDIATILQDFHRVLDSVKEAVPALVPFTDAEAAAYAAGRFSTYTAGAGLVTVFTDATERSPTFRLLPLDTVREPKRKCWIQVWAEAPDLQAAWLVFLGRPFRGLDPGFYRKPFEEQIEDSYLRTAALESLKKAGNDQADLYDLSFSSRNMKERGPAAGDVDVAVVLGDEAAGLERPDSYLRRFVDLSAARGAATFLVLAADRSDKQFAAIEASLRKTAVAERPGPAPGSPPHRRRQRPVRAEGAGRGQDAPQRPLDGHHGEAGQGRRQHDDQRQPEQPQAHRARDLPHPVARQRRPEPARLGQGLRPAESDHLRGGQRRPLRLHRLYQEPAGHGGADGRGGLVHRQGPRIAQTEARPSERRGAGDPAEDRPQRLPGFIALTFPYGRA